MGNLKSKSFLKSTKERNQHNEPVQTVFSAKLTVSSQYMRLTVVYHYITLYIIKMSAFSGDRQACSRLIVSTAVEHVRSEGVDVACTECPSYPTTTLLDLLRTT